MSEPQYQQYHNYPKEQLGSMASQYWRDDPKLLGIHLARYKFVSKMLAGKSLVAEVGCGDGWFSKVVAKEVGKLELFDFDKKMAPVDAVFLDISENPLPLPYRDAIYSLDCFEHIPRKSFYDALNYVKKSLLPNGVFIIGMPSFESQKYASEASKIGHVNCMSGDELKTHLQEFFRNVFLFSMNDEVIHTGFYPMAHYLMAICTGMR